MVNEVLKPCPFCGGEAVRMDFLDNPPFPNMRGTRYIGCRKCCVVSFTGMTDAEAVEAWNKRSERTCTVQNPSKYLQECSLCGGAVIASDNYCPKCGSKVIRNAD